MIGCTVFCYRSYRSGPGLKPYSGMNVPTANAACKIIEPEFLTIQLGFVSPRLQRWNRAGNAKPWRDEALADVDGPFDRFVCPVDESRYTIKVFNQHINEPPVMTPDITMPPPVGKEDSLSLFRAKLSFSKCLFSVSAWTQRLSCIYRCGKVL